MLYIGKEKKKANRIESMLQLEKILKIEFAEIDLTETKRNLATHGLYDPIVQAIDLINGHLQNSKHELKTYGSIQITHVATALLIKINEYFRILKKQKKHKVQKSLEGLLGSVLKRLLIQVIEILPENKKLKFAILVYNSLEETCKLYDYDFKHLMTFLGIESSASGKFISNTDSALIDPSKLEVNQIACYIWNHKLNMEFASFIGIVKKFKITEDINKFEQMFDYPNDNLAIRFDEKRAEFVMQFFAYLNDIKLMTTNGCGFYQVLECHVFDFKRVFLKDSTPQRIVDKIKKKNGWHPTKDRFEKEFKSCMKTSS